MIKLTDTLISVEVPVEAKDFKISPLEIGMNYLEYPDRTGCTKLPIPKGEYAIVGTVTKNTIDFEPEPYVEGNGMGCYNNYKGFPDNKFTELDPHDSFRSLLESKGLHFRPFKIYCGITKEWNEQEPTVKGKIVIIKKVN